MKKTLSLIAIASSLIFSSQANAKTEGNYLGIDLIRSSAQVKSNSNLASDASLSEWYNQKESDSAYGVGINYKHAFNFSNFFIAPGISYNLLSNDVKAGYAGTSNDPYSQSMKLKSQLTLQTNLGYDLNDKFSTYIPIGVSSFGYELNTSDNGGSGNIVTSKKSGYKTAAFIGLGFAYEPVKNWVVNLEYNKFQNLKVTSQTATTGGGQIVAKTNIEVVKLGLAYRF
jgi:opacity protein-like surface antigen